jgi:malate/lactate dehydrogenase
MKIGIVGCGMVGSTSAFALVSAESAVRAVRFGWLMAHPDGS